jgi:hypothetical protein
MSLKKERKFLIGVCILWALSVVAGTASILKYQNTSGAASPQVNWPADSAISPDKLDKEGIEAGRFQAAASGQNKNEKIVFSAGITASRGPEVDVNGREALNFLFKKGEAQQNKTPVYSCLLFAEESVAQK